MSGSNYNGRQPNNTSYIKNFVYGVPASLWKAILYTTTNGTVKSVLTPSLSKNENLYIPGDLFVDGSIVSPSDSRLKHNIQTLNEETTNKILQLKPTSFEFIYDKNKKQHYGFIANDFEKEYPELIEIKPDKNKQNIKSINYLELIPLLVNKIQIMQNEIDDLKKYKEHFENK